MSKNKQQHYQQNRNKTPEELHQEAVDKLNSTPSTEGIDQSFMGNAHIDEEVVVEVEEEEKPEYEATVQVDTTPDHIQTEKLKNVPTTTVDLKELRKRLSSSGSVCLEIFLKYIQDMAPNKPVSVQDGVRYQANLWSALDTLFNRLDDSDFNELYRALLQMFEEHKNGVFSDERVYRFVENWILPDAQSAAMKRILNLMLVTRNPATRHKSVQELKNWSYILEFGLTEQARNRIRNFYDL